MLDERLALADLRKGSERRAGFGQGAEELGQERLACLRHRLGGREAFDERGGGRGWQGAFEAYVESFLVPTLKRGQIVVMDDLSVHRSRRVERLIEEAGATLLFLPPYPPDMDPIEEAFSKVKGILRKAGARTREALVEATGHALNTITPQDIRGFYADCGYRLSLQSL